MQILNLETLELRRLRTDLTLIYKILHNILDINNENFLKVSELHSTYQLRRHSYYLDRIKNPRTAQRRNFFNYRIINTWNKLPNFIVTSTNLNIFKFNINKFNLNKIFKFYYK